MKNTQRKVDVSLKRIASVAKWFKEADRQTDMCGIHSDGVQYNSKDEAHDLLMQEGSDLQLIIREYGSKVYPYELRCIIFGVQFYSLVKSEQGVRLAEALIAKGVALTQDVIDRLNFENPVEKVIRIR